MSEPLLHVESYGTGAPVTVFAGGLGGAVAETRTLASGVAGTRVFFDFRGHGASGVPDDGDWSYAALSRDLRRVADEHGATRAAGISMGAAAILGVVADDPERFARNVFVLPAILDRPRHDVAADDAYVRQRAGALSAAAVAGLVRALAETTPVADRNALAAVPAPCLVVGQEGDDVHPARVARELAAVLPDARLHVFEPSAGIWTHRRALRSLVSAFLNG